MTDGIYLSEILDRIKDLHEMDLTGDVTGTAARTAYDGINYLKSVTSEDETAQRALNSICQYIIHVELKWLGIRNKQC